MTAPGPSQLGRSVVVLPGRSAPSEWRDAERIVIDQTLLADPEALAATVASVQHRYVLREPTVFELGIDPVELSEPETINAPPNALGATFTFLRERLLKAVWHNSYDARGDELVWWWSRKATELIDVEVGGPADVLGADGTPYWIDGGPRHPLDLDEAVIHHESVEQRRLAPIPAPVVPMVDLAPDQLAAVSHHAGPSRVIAPAGSGKTKVLTARIRHLIADQEVEPEIITALAYNRRAAREMAERLGDLRGLNIRTIHSLGWEILRMARPGVRLIDESEQRRRLEPIAAAVRRVNTDVIGPYLEAMDEVRIGFRDPAEVESERDDVPGFADTFRRYRDGLDQRGEADHAEQIYGSIEALCRDPDLRSYWQARCRHLLVDEFQDLTPAYLLLVRLVASPGLNVFGVGDDDQVIYGYAGADPVFLIDFEDLFPGAEVHALQVNYRCPVDVVDAASTLLGYNRKRVEKIIRADSVDRGLEVLRHPGDDLAQTTYTRIRSLLDDGGDPGSVAVLCRVNSSLLPLHALLAESGVPFRSPLSVTILERTVVRGALAWVRLALDTTKMSRNDLFEAVRRPQRGLNRLLSELIGRRRGPFSIDELAGWIMDVDVKKAHRWKEFCEDILTASRATESTSLLLETLSEAIGLDRAAAALDGGRTRADRAAQSDDLVALRRAAALQPAPALFESWLKGCLRDSAKDHGVVLSTVHRVKGLEWDHVIIFGADRGSMPHALSGDIEEERRVFHVALTRAKATATVLADESRPSPFLAELAGTARRPAEIQTKAATAPVDDSRPQADPVLLEKLKTWRLEQARARGLPAYVVFNDRTLEELAARRPTTESGLLAVSGIGPAKLDAYGDDLLDLLL